MTTLKLLYIEDQASFAELVEETLVLDKEKNWELIWAKSLDEAFRISPPDSTHLLLLDLGLADSHGLETAKKAKPYLNSCPTLIFTTREERQLALDALKIGAQDFMLKTDFEPQQLLRRLDMTRERFILREEIEQHLKELAQRHHELDAILSSTDEGIALLGREGHIRYANEIFLDVFQTRLDETPLKWTTCLKKEDQHSLLESLKEGAEAWWTLPRIHPNKSTEHPFRLRMRSVQINEGKDRETLVILQDLSHEDRLREMERELQEAREVLGQKSGLGPMVGESLPMQKVYEGLKVAARSELSIMIHGESGTGKELAARAIHQLSPRVHGPFIAINCAALPEHLIESELFGHVKGAFTGASADRKGLILEAEGGSLFLDEIGEMPPALQSKLLRVLQEKTLRRVGDSEEVPVNARIISATNIDIQACIDDKSFREDLFYRLSEFPITLPPLRERIDDLMPLAMHFLKLQGQTTDPPKRGFSRDALQKLKEHPWPGNIRELRSCIQRACLLEKGEEITALSLDWNLPSQTPRSSESGFYHLARPTSLEEVERQVILRTLNEVGQNFSKAAELLKINRATLYRKIRKYEDLTP